MSELIERIVPYADQFEISISRGKCPVNKLFMMTRCQYGDMLEIRLPSTDDEVVANTDIVYLLEVEAKVLSAHHHDRTPWGWKPDRYDKGTLCFYGTNLDTLLKEAGDWFEAHKDPIAPPFKSNRYVSTDVLPIKCEPIGRVRHYTTVEGFEEGNLEPKRSW